MRLLREQKIASFVECTTRQLQRQVSVATATRYRNALAGPSAIRGGLLLTHSFPRDAWPCHCGSLSHESPGQRNTQTRHAVGGKFTADKWISLREIREAAQRVLQTASRARIFIFCASSSAGMAANWRSMRDTFENNHIARPFSSGAENNEIFKRLSWDDKRPLSRLP